MGEKFTVGLAEHPKDDDPSVEGDIAAAIDYAERCGRGRGNGIWAVWNERAEVVALTFEGLVCVPRGQGRRANGQVVGGMSAAPTGKRVYRDYRASVPGGMTDAEYNEIRVFAQDEDRDRYVGLRQAGTPHGDACLAVYRAGDSQ